MTIQRNSRYNNHNQSQNEGKGKQTERYFEGKGKQTARSFEGIRPQTPATKKAVPRSKKQGNSVALRKAPGTYITWDKPVAGENGLTYMEILMDFLLKSGGENLDRYLGSRKDGTTTGTTKVSVINNIVQYFASKGLEVKFDSVKTKMTNLTTKMYREAYAEFTGSGNGAMGDRSINGNDEFTGNPCLLIKLTCN